MLPCGSEETSIQYLFRAPTQMSPFQASEPLVPRRNWGITDQLQLRTLLSLELYHANVKALSLILASFHLLTWSGRVLVLPAEVPSFKLRIKLSFSATGT